MVGSPLATVDRDASGLTQGGLELDVESVTTRSLLSRRRIRQQSVARTHRSERRPQVPAIRDLGEGARTPGLISTAARLVEHVRERPGLLATRVGSIERLTPRIVWVSRLTEATVGETALDVDPTGRESGGDEGGPELPDRRAEKVFGVASLGDHRDVHRSVLDRHLDGNGAEVTGMHLQTHVLRTVGSLGTLGGPNDVLRCVTRSDACDDRESRGLRPPGAISGRHVAGSRGDSDG